MIPRTALQARVGEWGLTEEVVEKDYVLGWLLAGIGAHPVLGSTWVFKGGTCLKKCYIETYRFSEDLDFTVLEGGPLAPEDLVPVLLEVLDAVEQASGLQLSDRAPVVRLRPGGRSAEGRIYYRGPRGAPGEARVKFDLTYDELVVEPTVARLVTHAYEDDLPAPATVRCYAFAEVFAEKLRALGQRTRPRDLYDVVNLFRRADVHGDRGLVLTILERKCEYKGIPVPTLEAVTAPDKVADLRADWESMLEHQLPALPPVDEFLDALADLFAWIEGAEPVVLEPVPMREALEAEWIAPPTITRWPGGAPLEQIRFAGSNHLLVELRYQGSTRLIEPYSLRRSKAGDLLVYALKHETGEIRAYRVDRIQGVRITTTPFRPSYAIELSVALPVATGRRGPRPRARGPRPGARGRRRR
ncbi:MAG TPA: nucleotidyl transferase AbiEii/AbiGii toxin family protein [Solirubrobacteraceae bacterium]|nr:nucleotidyl transferase AbiEii/AbiGii toxin family protein [Solirubrobacteraceae bacterium]